MRKMNQIIIEKFLEELEEEGESFSINVEGEEDFTEIDWDEDCIVVFDEDSVLFKWFIRPDDETKTLCQNLIRISKIISICTV